MNKLIISLLAIISIAAGAGAYIITQQQGSSSLNQQELDKLGLFLFPNGISVADVSFTDEESQTKAKNDLQGKWSLLFFGYTFCPDICPTTLSVMQQMWSKMTPEQQTQFEVVLVSVDPARDTPEQMKTYMDYFEPAFTSLTGNEASLKSLATQLNAVYAKVPRYDENGNEDPELGYLMDHSANIAILNPQGEYAGFIKPPFNSKKMLAISKLLLAR